MQMLDGWTPLMYAATNGYLLTTEMMVNEGCCDINAQDKFKRTALHWVARYNNNKMVDKLLKLGINQEIKDSEGHTAYDLAI
jgi:ankyrin repeat protein